MRAFNSQLDSCTWAAVHSSSKESNSVGPHRKFARSFLIMSLSNERELALSKNPLSALLQTLICKTLPLSNLLTFLISTRGNTEQHYRVKAPACTCELNIPSASAFSLLLCCMIASSLVAYSLLRSRKPCMAGVNTRNITAAAQQLLWCLHTTVSTRKHA